LDTAIARFKSVKLIKDELRKTKTSLDERKYIDKAKGLLIMHKSISEEEAYAMLRKMAMESNKRIGQAAQDVISVLQALG
jgi:response regulator NasT